MRIHCIETGQVQIKRRHLVARHMAHPARMLDVLTDGEWARPMPIGCWLIEHDDGPILVDTGESPAANDPGYQPAWHPFMRFCERRWVRPDEAIAARIAALGFAPDDIRLVIMTHMHGDHAGGIGSFPNARFSISATEIRAALSPTGPLLGYLNGHYPRWFRPEPIAFQGGAWQGFSQSAAVNGDARIKIVPTPGHTHGHVSVVVDQGDHQVLIAGDAAYSEESLIKGVVDGVAQSASRHRQSTARLRALCRARPTITLFAHEAASAERLRRARATVPPAEGSG